MAAWTWEFAYIFFQYGDQALCSSMQITATQLSHIMLTSASYPKPLNPKPLNPQPEGSRSPRLSTLKALIIPVDAGNLAPARSRGLSILITPVGCIYTCTYIIYNSPSIPHIKPAWLRLPAPPSTLNPEPSALNPSPYSQGNLRTLVRSPKF